MDGGDLLTVKARLIAIALACVPLAAPAAETPQARASFATGTSRVTMPLRSFRELRDQGIVKQRLDYSCGPAALATLLTYTWNDPASEIQIIHGILLHLEQGQEAVRRKEGFSLLDLQRVAQARGYKAQGFRIAPEYLDKLAGPVIVFIRPRGFEHFAVFKGMRGGRVHLADPSLGNMRRARYDFLPMWLGDDGKGIVFVVEPNDPARSGGVLASLQDPHLPRPEILTVRQMLEVSRTLSPAGQTTR
jgi:predicted double-glycine peptidase